MISEEKRKKEGKLKELTKHARVFRDRVAGGKKKEMERERERGRRERGESVQIYKLLCKLLVGIASHA